MDSIDHQDLLIEKVVRRRAEDVFRGVRRHHPSVTAETEIKNGRGVVTAFQDRFTLSKEFVETEESLRSPHCIPEYRRVLQGKARLVLIVPKEMATKTF